MNSPRIIVAYGGGTNSVAVLCGMHERGERPDLILFADTGGEKSHTYSHIAGMQSTLLEWGWPEITVVRLVKPRGWESLEQQCRRLKVMPSIAYGFKTCSQRYKIEPQESFLTTWAPGNEPLVKIIGYDFDETRRWLNKPATYGRYHLRFPLVEWQWGREECLEAINRAGIPSPGKSACFFCPSSKKPEIHWLAANEPELYARAIEMERDAREGRPGDPATGFKTVKGLGRSFSWEDMIGPDGSPDQDCGCYDGEFD